jgi:hypothetical protein
MMLRRIVIVTTSALVLFGLFAPVVPFTKIAAAKTGWQRIPTNVAPPDRYDLMLVDTGAFRRLVLFGGRTAEHEPLADTWIFDLATDQWRQVKPMTSPMARLGAAAAFDVVLKCVIIFGGQAQNGKLNDVWAFDIEKETWQQIATIGTPPVARYGVSGVIDPSSDLFIVSHGFADTRYDDTFALDLKTNTWTDISPAARPLKRCLHEAIYDINSKKMILFGGCSSGFGPCPQGDLWSYDVTARMWTELEPGNATPSPRSNPALVFDPAGRDWLFGGRIDGGYSAELWSLNPLTNTWTQHPVDGGPSPRASHDAVWDTVGQRLIVFGGQTEQGVMNDLWVFQP